jgi:hypothetical protein
MDLNQVVRIVAAAVPDNDMPAGKILAIEQRFPNRLSRQARRKPSQKNQDTNDEYYSRCKNHFYPHFSATNVASGDPSLMASGNFLASSLTTNVWGPAESSGASPLLCGTDLPSIQTGAPSAPLKSKEIGPALETSNLVEA